jgi:hypothetical protein
MNINQRLDAQLNDLGKALGPSYGGGITVLIMRFMGSWKDVWVHGNTMHLFTDNIAGC